MAKDKTIAVLAADAFQDSEYFLPKVEIEKLGVRTEVVSLGPDPIEIYSFFDRIGHLEVQKTIAEANPDDYIGVLVPGGAKSPAILAENPDVLRFLRAIDGGGKLGGLDLSRFAPDGEIRDRKGPANQQAFILRTNSPTW